MLFGLHEENIIIDYYIKTKKNNRFFPPVHDFYKLI